MVSEMEKTIDWNGKAEKARGMSDDELRYAIKDCYEAARAGMDEGYYSDEGSIYYTELKKREAKRAKKEATRLARNKRSREARRNRDGVMRDMGMKKVRGALGGTYYE